METRPYVKPYHGTKSFFQGMHTHGAIGLVTIGTRLKKQISKRDPKIFSMEQVAIAQLGFERSLFGWTVLLGRPRRCPSRRRKRTRRWRQRRCARRW